MTRTEIHKEKEALVEKVAGGILEQLRKGRQYDALFAEAQDLKQENDLLEVALAAGKADAEVRAEQISELEAQLKDLSERASEDERGLFVADPGFKREKLSSSERVLYDLIWQHINTEFKTTIVPIKADTATLHLKRMREVQDTSHYCLLVLDHWGDPRALEALMEIWDIVLDPKNFATGYGETGADPALEQPGVIRLNYLGVDSGTTSAGAWNNDLHALDWCLQTGTVGEVKFALRQNLRLVEHNLYVRLRDYSEALKARLVFLSAAKHPGKPWWAWASTLWHPVTSRFAWHYFEWLDTADVMHLEAWRAIGPMLEANRDRITISDGRVLLFVPHQVREWQQLLYKGAPSEVVQDVTYTRETAPHDLILMWAGSPFHNAADVAAYARTMHVSVLGGQGGKILEIPATIGGVGPVEGKGKRFVYAGRAGTAYPSRWVSDRPEKKEGVFQVTRGLAFVGSHLATESGNFLRNLTEMSGTADAKERKSFANRLAEMLYTARR